MNRIAELAPDAATFTDLDEFLAHPELDAVYIATPNHLHRSICERAARAGKHVLCEKPMATTVVDAQFMVDACDANNVRYATAFDQRFHAAHQIGRELIKSGCLGEITLARVHYACWTPRDWTPDGLPHDNWRIDPARAGGGAFIDLAPHGLDLTQMLLDEPLVEIACLLQKHVFDYAVDDGAALIGRFQNGALLLMNVAYNCPDNFPRRTLELIGTKGMLQFQNTMGQTPGGTLQLIDESGARENIELPAELDISPFQNGVEAFASALLKGEPFAFSPERDLHTMKLLEAAQNGAGGVHIEPMERVKL